MSKIILEQPNNMWVIDFFPFFKLFDNFTFENGIFLDFLLHEGIDAGILINEFVVSVGMVLLFGFLALDALLGAHLYI